MLSFYLSMLDSEQEREKMAEIYENHRYPLLMYAMKILKNQELAEDAVHTTFIAIIEQKEKYFSLDDDILRFSAISINHSTTTSSGGMRKAPIRGTIQATPKGVVSQA